MRRLGWLAGFVAGVGFLGVGAGAQTAATVVDVPVPLLGPILGPMPGGLVRTGDAVTGEDPAQADPAHGAELREDGLQRFSKAQYGRTHVEAMQFGDATGAYSAYTLYLKSGAKTLKEDEWGGAKGAVVDGRTLVLAQTVVAIVDAGAEPGALSKIVLALPKVSGPKGQPPLLPTFFPRKALVPGSLRYAVGPAGYAAMGGTLGASQLGWEKSAEAAMAEYADRRGKETLTLLLYPTPQIAGEHTRALQEQAGNGTTKVRREGELVAVAAGTFSADDAQNMVENIHMRSEVSMDKPLPLEFNSEIHKTYSLLTSIAVFCGVGGLAAVMLGVFLGGGRALFRKMRGKDAATEAEFLSLHLDPQNQAPRFPAGGVEGARGGPLGLG
jgi:hypothetical protein